jgi:hypothetical protein
MPYYALFIVGLSHPLFLTFARSSLLWIQLTLLSASMAKIFRKFFVFLKLYGLLIIDFNFNVIMSHFFDWFLYRLFVFALIERQLLLMFASID